MSHNVPREPARGHHRQGGRHGRGCARRRGDRGAARDAIQVANRFVTTTTLVWLSSGTETGSNEETPRLPSPGAAGPRHAAEYLRLGPRFFHIAGELGGWAGGNSARVGTRGDNGSKKTALKTEPRCERQRWRARIAG